MPGVAVDVIAELLTPETITGSSESRAIPVFLDGGAGGEVAVAPLAEVVGAGLMKLGI